MIMYVKVFCHALYTVYIRYGIRAPVYLKDKHGLVAQPNPNPTASTDDKVVFHSGEYITTTAVTNRSFILATWFLFHCMHDIFCN